MQVIIAMIQSVDNSLSSSWRPQQANYSAQSSTWMSARIGEIGSPDRRFDPWLGQHSVAIRGPARHSVVSHPTSPACMLVVIDDAAI